MGPVGGGYGSGAVENPVIKGVAVGILTTPLSGTGACMSGAFTSFSAFGRSLIGFNTFKAGLGSAAADFTIQTAFQIGQNGKISIGEYNVGSLTANAIFSHPFTTAFLGSGFQVNLSMEPFKNSVFQDKSMIQFGVETSVGTLFNIAAGKGGHVHKIDVS